MITGQTRPAGRTGAKNGAAATRAIPAAVPNSDARSTGRGPHRWISAPPARAMMPPGIAPKLNIAPNVFMSMPR